MCIPLHAISDAIKVQLQGNAHVTDYLWRSVVCIPINTAVRYKGYVSKRTKRQLLLNSIQYKQYVTMSGLNYSALYHKALLFNSANRAAILFVAC